MTSRVIDGFGEGILEQNPDRGKRTYWYDGGGNLIKLLDGDNTYWEFTSDPTSGGNYGIGRLTTVSDGSGSTSQTYDAQGRVIAAVHRGLRLRRQRQGEQDHLSVGRRGDHRTYDRWPGHRGDADAGRRLGPDDRRRELSPASFDGGPLSGSRTARRPWLDRQGFVHPDSSANRQRGFQGHCW